MPLLEYVASELVPAFASIIYSESVNGVYYSALACNCSYFALMMSYCARVYVVSISGVVR
jgi:hypothetical protein